MKFIFWTMKIGLWYAGGGSDGPDGYCGDQ